MRKEKLHIGTWEVCCNDMAGALIDDNIQATDPAVEDFHLYINEGSHLVCCPWCTKKIENTT